MQKVIQIPILYAYTQGSSQRISLLSPSVMPTLIKRRDDVICSLEGRMEETSARLHYQIMSVICAI